MKICSAIKLTVRVVPQLPQYRFFFQKLVLALLLKKISPFFGYFDSMCHISLLFYPFSVFGLIFICQEEDDQMDNLINHVLSSDENSRNEVFHHSLKMV